MAAQVAGELYESITGQLFEIGRQLRQPNGYPFDPVRLKGFLQLAVEGKFDGIEVPPIKPRLQLLEKVGTADVSGADKVVSTWQVDNHSESKVRIAWLGGNFKQHFYGKVEENIAESQLKVYRLRKSSRDPAIVAELGGEEIVETTLHHMWELLTRQGQGEDGTLLTNGYANIFYVRDKSGILWAVYCRWDSVDRGWHVEADSVGDPFRWYGGYQVFSR